MFGVLRSILAFLVAISHLWLQGGHLGIYAVFGFYVISGYLMTLIMHRTYKYTGSGQKAFIANRLIRLFPLYWCAIAISMALIFLSGEEFALAYHSRIYTPSSLTEWISNLTMMFIVWRPIDFKPMLAPASWALTVEIFFYALICIGISRTFHRVLVWLLLSVLYVFITFVLDLPWHDRFFPIAAGSLPFAIGSAIYFLPCLTLPQENLDRLARLCFAAMILNSVFWCTLRMSGNYAGAEVGFYLNLAMCAGLVWCIVSGGVIWRRLVSWDKRIGDYSYPIYLLHWQVGLLVSWLVFGQPIIELSIVGTVNFALSMAVLLTLCYVILRYIDEPVQRAREWVKSQLRSRGPDQTQVIDCHDAAVLRNHSR